MPVKNYLVCFFFLLTRVYYNTNFLYYVAMPVIGKFDPKSKMSTDKTNFDLDFNSITMNALHDILIPINWTCSRTGIIHGVAGWFDILFNPSEQQGNSVTLSTSPFTDITHWYQTKFLFLVPLPVKAQQTIKGWMRCIANSSRSYTIYIELVIQNEEELSDPNLLFSTELNSEFKRRGVWELQEQTYDDHQFMMSV